MKIVIKNGRVIDPASRTDRIMDILISGDIIEDMAENIRVDSDAGVVDAAGCIVTPGLIDMHVHFREPGREDVETILGGSRVAAKGGFTSVCTMPNTSPMIDNQALVRFIKMQAEKGPINVYPVAKITAGAEGRNLSEMGELINAGAVAFSDDGMPVNSSIVMRRALEYSRMFDVPLLTHSEDLELTDGGIMNEGVNSTILGLKGIPRESEEVMVARDILLTRMTRGRMHVCHVSSAGTVELIEWARRKGIDVTCETAPHYFTLTDDAVATHLAMAKMKPPLRTEKDRQAMIEGLRSGIIDVIATDHAPHSLNEKMQEMEYAPFGIIGLETAVPLIITVLVKQNGFSYLQAFEKVTVNPARILKLDAGVLAKGRPADIAIINPDREFTVDRDFILSHCKNTPFMGMTLSGSVEYTICNGNIVYSRAS
jgi:dihydroorotase